MICLAYLSSASGALSAGEVNDILAVSRDNNARDGITGLLCHYDGSFLQFLEGEPETVGRTFARIGRDPRHGGLIEVYRKSISERAFGAWTMGVVKPDQIDAAQRAFCTGLRGVQIAAAGHSTALQPFLDAFRAWLR